MADDNTTPLDPNSLAYMLALGATSQPNAPAASNAPMPPPPDVTAQQPQQQTSSAPVYDPSGQPLPPPSDLTQPGQRAAQTPIPHMGGQPLLMQYVQALMHPNQGGVDPNTGQPTRPVSRGDATLEFLGNFLSNMSAGLAQSGHGPGANLRGAGAAMQAPYQRALQGYQLGQQQQLQESQIAEQQARTAQLSNIVQTPYGPMSQGLAMKVLPAAIGKEGKVEAAQAQKRFMSTPFGMFDAQSGTYVGGPSGSNAVQVTPAIAEDYSLPKELVGKTITPQTLAQFMRSQAVGTRTVMGAEGPAMVSTIGPNRGQTTNLGLGNPAAAARMAGPVQVADPNNPGQTKWMTARDAVRMGMAGPGSASVTVPRQVMNWATSGKGGEEINAFNTALQHADLLEQAAVALHNGDQRTLAGLNNRMKTEFGSADVTNFQVIANAYTREVTKMLSSGHMTDQEVAQQGATLPANASPEQIIGAVNSYRALATSKMNMRYNQYQQGLQGKPNFPQGTGGSAKASDFWNKK